MNKVLDRSKTFRNTTVEKSLAFAGLFFELHLLLFCYVIITGLGWDYENISSS